MKIRIPDGEIVEHENTSMFASTTREARIEKDCKDG